MAKKTKRKNDARQEALNEIFGTDPVELAANETGVIPPTQQAKILQRHITESREQSRTIEPFLVFMAFVILTLWLLSSSSVLLLILVVECLAILLFPRVVIAYSHWRLKNALAQGKVATVQGKVAAGWGDIRTIDKIRINGKRLKIPVAALVCIIEGETYRVHYLPQQKQVLSMKIIDDDDNLSSGITYQASTDNNAAQESSQ